MDISKAEYQPLYRLHGEHSCHNERLGSAWHRMVVAGAEQSRFVLLPTSQALSVSDVEGYTAPVRPASRPRRVGRSRWLQAKRNESMKDFAFNILSLCSLALCAYRNNSRPSCRSLCYELQGVVYTHIQNAENRRENKWLAGDWDTRSPLTYVLFPVVYTCRYSSTSLALNTVSVLSHNVKNWYEVFPDVLINQSYYQKYFLLSTIRNMRLLIRFYLFFYLRNDVTHHRCRSTPKLKLIRTTDDNQIAKKSDFAMM